MSSVAVGMKERQAITRRTVSVALDQAEGVMPIFDELVEHAATVRHGGHFEQILPAIPKSMPQRQPLPEVSPSIKTRSVPALAALRYDAISIDAISSDEPGVNTREPKEPGTP